MPLEISAHPFAVTWAVHEADPCLVRWTRNRGRRRWQLYRRYDTPEEARRVVTAYGQAQFIPTKGQSDATEF